MELILLAAIGAGAGLVAGLVGLAGGIVVVPALTWFYGASALHAAIVVSWFSVLFNSMGAAANQWRCRDAAQRRELLSCVRWYLLGIAVVTPLVAITATHFHEFVSATAVAVLQLCLAAVMLWPVDDAPRPPRPHVVRDVSFGGVIAAVSTLIGVGGGTYTIAYFVYGTGTRFRDAIAAANFTGLLVGVLSVAGYAVALVLFERTSVAGPINGWGMGVLVAAGMAAAPLGSMLSHRLPTKVLRTILVLALVASAVRMLLTA